MPDLHYTDPDLVAIYDLFNGWSVDRDYYAGLAGPKRRRILEVGCGTGLVARAIAGQGHDVTGLDPAQPMLDFAALAACGAQVDWVCGVLTDFDAAPFDLIFMTGHAFQCLMTNAEIAAFFVAAKRLLASGAVLAFETRNPAVKAWERWVPAHTTRTLSLPDGRQVTEWHELTDVDGETVCFRSIYTFTDRQLVSESTLRFAGIGTLTDLARDAGLSVRTVFGDWDRSPLTQESPEIILQLTSD